jgi:hypothetical protein
MAAFQDAVSRLTVETVYRTQGAAESTQQLRQFSTEQDNLTIAAKRNVTATGQQEQALVRMQRAAQLASDQTRQLTGATDISSKSLQAANDNAQGVGKSLVDTGSAILSTVGHLKLLALGAYAMSPAFRSVANAGLATTLRAIGPAAATAAGTVVSVFSPALAFLTRLTVPIAAAVLAWKALVSLFEQGANLLSKYGTADRSLVSGVDESLAKLTKYQNETLSPDVVRRATELSTRLTEAKKTITDFMEVSIDLNKASLGLQWIWVTIVEKIAEGLKLMQRMANTPPPMPGNMNYGEATTGMPSYSTPAATSSKGDLDVNSIGMQKMAATKVLAGALGSNTNFQNRYGNAVKDIDEINKKKPDKPNADADAADAWDRASDSIAKHTARLAADSLAIGQSTGVQEGLRAEFQLLEAAKQADRGVTDEQIAAYTTLRATMSSQESLTKSGIELSKDDTDEFLKSTEAIRKKTEAYAKLRIQSQIKFDRDTAFLSPEDVRIAQALKDIYPDVTQAINSTEAATMRLSGSLRKPANENEKQPEVPHELSARPAAA